MSSDGAPDLVSAARKKSLFCPSTQPSSDRSMILGVVGNNETGASISFLQHPVRVDKGTLLSFVGGTTKATEVFRFAAPCETSGCRNWSGCHCRVAERLVQILPIAADALPQCRLRPVCRWFAQEGGSVCLRCPHVVTDNPEMEATLNYMPSHAGNTNSTDHDDQQPVAGSAHHL